MKETITTDYYWPTEPVATPIVWALLITILFVIISTGLMFGLVLANL